VKFMVWKACKNIIISKLLGVSYMDRHIPNEKRKK
jgi:hypothetical protein